MLGGAIAAVLASPVSLPMVAIGMAPIQFFIAIGIAFSWGSLVIGHVVLVIAYPLRTIRRRCCSPNRRRNKWRAHSEPDRSRCFEL